MWRIGSCGKQYLSGDMNPYPRGMEPEGGALVKGESRRIEYSRCRRKRTSAIFLLLGVKIPEDDPETLRYFVRTI